jgi:DNA polymerase-3 subunit epsilon
MAKNKSILVFDFETTGLTLHPDVEATKQPRAIEFGAALLNGATGEIELEVEMKFNPQESLNDDIIRITGLTDADLRDAPTFADSLSQLRDLFEQSGGIAAHNLPFDRAILRGELTRANVLDFPWPPRQLCTVGLYVPLWGRNPKLTELYALIMGEPLAQTHRALDDVHALVRIMQKEQLWRIENFTKV